MNSYLPINERWEWVEIMEPKTKNIMYVNLASGDCVWDPPQNVQVKKMDRNQWWELYDSKTCRFYYYNAFTESTVWYKPASVDIIPLAKLQCLTVPAERPNRGPSLGTRSLVGRSRVRCDSETSVPTVSYSHHPYSVLYYPPVYDPRCFSNDAYCGLYYGILKQNTEVPGDPSSRKEMSTQTAMNAELRFLRRSASHRGSGGSHRTRKPSLSSGTALPPPSSRRPGPGGDYDNVTYATAGAIASDLPSSGAATPTQAGPVSTTPKSFQTWSSSGQPLPRSPCPAAAPAGGSGTGSTLPSALKRRHHDTLTSTSSSTSSSSPLTRAFEEQCTVSETSVDSGLPDNSSWDSLDSHLDYRLPPPSQHHYASIVVTPASPHASHYGTPVIARHPHRAFPRTNPTCGLNRTVTATSGLSDTQRESSSSGGTTQETVESPVSVIQTSVPPVPASVVQVGPSQSNMSVSSSGTESTISGPQPPANSVPSASPGTPGPCLKSEQSGNASSSLSSLSTSIATTPYAPVYPLVSMHEQTRPQSMHIVMANPQVAASATPETSSACSTPPPAVQAIQQQMASSQSSPTPSGHFPGKSRSLPISQGNGDSSSVDGSAALPGWSVSLFRRELQTQPADRTLTWMKEALTKPLLHKTDKSMKKEVVELFKYVQQYMDDRKTKLSRPQLAVTVTQRGWATVGLRDELYMMLCKQTTNNPRDESLYRGWELLGTCLAFFPPSALFRPYLEGYILRHLQPQQPGDPPCPPRLPHYARASHRRLQRACQAGARRGTQGLSSEEVWHAKQTILSRAMFGSTLAEVLQLQQERLPELQLPWIQTSLSEQVLRHNGAATEGIFRVPGDIDSVNNLKVACEQWEMSETLCADPHVPASLLKLWYRELAEPLIPFEFYEACLAAQDDPAEAANIVSRLPDLNRLCLVYLVRFLQVFAADESVLKTKMDVNNLAMVMAPNVLRSQASDPKVIFENTRPQMAFLRLLILHLDTTEIDGLR